MALRGTPRPSAIPASQNTAPVNEYRCLFTSDLRRKQKRWQDGYLKFHTFNSRVMVYDTSRNFLGDTYWKEPNEVQEGDELTLDKGIMVEVAEAMGVTQTDLTPILERKKDSPQSNKTAPIQKVAPRHALPTASGLRTGSQLRHKSLNTLLGTPKGPIGKSAPMRSPFETRQEKENQAAEERAAKRQKTAQSLVEQRISSPVAVHEPQPQPKTNLSLGRQASCAKTVRPLPRPLPRPAAIITLESEPDNMSSDVTLPSTPPGMVRPMSRSTKASVPNSSQGAAENAPTFTTPRIPKGRVPVPHVKAQETPRPPPEPSSPPISASNRLSNVDFALQSARNPLTTTEVTVQEAEQRPVNINLRAAQPAQKPLEAPSLPPSPPQNLKAKSLRLSKGVKRGRLLCQSAPPQKQAFTEPKQTTKPKPKQKQIAEPSRHGIIYVISDDEDIQPHEPSKFSRAASGPQKKRKHVAQAAASGSKPKPPSPSPGPSLDAFDDMEFRHGLMDQQLMITPSPPQVDDSTKGASPTRNDQNPTPGMKKPPKKGKRAAEASPEKSARPKKTKTATAKEGAAKPRAKKKQVEKPQPVRQASPPASPVLDSTEHTSRDTSAQPSISIMKRSGTASVSVSPTKLLALSTGGFRKRSKGAQSKPAATEIDAPAPCPVTVALPPHPLRANRSGPLMSTTELSALLTKSTKPMRLEDDPIEDSTQRTTPSKSFQRSRSENDAPIPSMSEAWEQRNLPKASASSKESATSILKPDEAPSKPKAGGLAALVKKTDPRRKFQRTQSLNVNTNVPGIAEPEVVTPPPDHDVGPWSTEAFDLFDWRPPNAESEEQSNGIFVNER